MVIEQEEREWTLSDNGEASVVAVGTDSCFSVYVCMNGMRVSVISPEMGIRMASRFKGWGRMEIR